MRAVAFLLVLGLGAASRCREDSEDGSGGPSDSSEMAPKDLVRPRIVIVGQTGSGKSSLANSLLGVNPQLDTAIFPVGTRMGSCTKKTRANTGRWLGTGPHFTVVDTPGFGDGDGEMSELIDEMLDVLKNHVKSADVIILLVKGTENRFNESLQKMLGQMSSIFGEQWWEYMMIGVSFWRYRQRDIDDRDMDCPGDFCTNESWFQSEIEVQLNEKFKLNRRFPIAFAHSHSQTERGRDDPLQQEYWGLETQKIWDFANSKNTTDTTFQFKDVDDILVENMRLKRDVSSLNQTINENMTEMRATIENIQSDVDRKGVQQMAAIDMVKSDVDKKGVQQMAAIDMVKSDVDKKGVEQIALMDKVQRDLYKKVADLTIAPIGTITAWVTRPALGGNYVNIPSGWVRCDGSTIPNPSIWAGMTTPNLNGEKRFLRGGRDRDALRTEEDQMQDHKHEVNDPGHRHGVTDPGHKHDVTDPGHRHAYDDKYTSWANGVYGYWGPDDSDKKNDRFDQSHGSTSDYARTGIRINKDHTGLSVDGASTGLHVEGVSSSYRKGTETRPKNMSVIYIMKVW